MPIKEHPVYNIRFGFICLGSLFFSASYNMLIPELPAYLSSLGGAEYKGFIISLFTLTAGLSRPFSGKLTDTIGRKPVMVIGALVCLICGFLYPILGSVAGFLALRLFHGFSTGFSPTAFAAYVSDMVPANRWGEALGVQSLFFGTGLALGPALGSYIKLYHSFDALFYASSALALLAIVLVSKLQETHTGKQRFQWTSLRISRQDILAYEVVAPAIVMFLSYLAFGVILTLIPDWSEHLEVENKGTFFIVFTVSSLLVRIVAGRLSDRYGRVPLIYSGLGLLLLSLAVLGRFDTITGLMTGSAIYGLAMGILTPSLNAWTVDQSVPGHRGKAMATLYIALEAGIGLGALLSGWYFQNTITRMPTIFHGCAAMALLAVIYLLFRPRSHRSTQRS